MARVRYRLDIVTLCRATLDLTQIPSRWLSFALSPEIKMADHSPPNAEVPTVSSLTFRTLTHVLPIVCIKFSVPRFIVWSICGDVWENVTENVIVFNCVMSQLFQRDHNAACAGHWWLVKSNIRAYITFSVTCFGSDLSSGWHISRGYTYYMSIDFSLENATLIVLHAQGIMVLVVGWPDQH